MKNLIKQTLERDFDLPQYTDFVKNLFNEIQIKPQEIKVPGSSKEFIKKITFLSDFLRHPEKDHRYRRKE